MSLFFICGDLKHHTHHESSQSKLIFAGAGIQPSVNMFVPHLIDIINKPDLPKTLLENTGNNRANDVFFMLIGSFTFMPSILAPPSHSHTIYHPHHHCISRHHNWPSWSVKSCRNFSSASHVSAALVG